MVSFFSAPLPSHGCNYLPLPMVTTNVFDPTSIISGFATRTSFSLYPPLFRNAPLYPGFLDTPTCIHAIYKSLNPKSAAIGRASFFSLSAFTFSTSFCTSYQGTCTRKADEKFYATIGNCLGVSTEDISTVYHHSCGSSSGGGPCSCWRSLRVA